LPFEFALPILLFNRTRIETGPVTAILLRNPAPNTRPVGPVAAVRRLACGRCAARCSISIDVDRPWDREIGPEFKLESGLDFGTLR